MTVHHGKSKSTGITVSQDGTKRFLFCLVRPSGRVDCVLDAPDIMSAWRGATGLGDKGIAERKGSGWNLYPCSVVWRE